MRYTRENFPAGRLAILEQGATDPWAAVASSLVQANGGDPSNAGDVQNTLKLLGGPGGAAMIGNFILPGFGLVIGAVVGFLASLIGIKGPTGHMSLDQARDASDKIARQWTELYKKVPADGQAKLFSLIQDFNTAMLARFGSWWDGIVKKDWEPGGEMFQWIQANPTIWAGTESKMYHWIQRPIMWCLIRMDVQTAKSQLNDWIINETMKDTLTDPFAIYVKDKLGTTIAQVTAGKYTTTAASTAGKVGVTVAGVVALGLAMSRVGKRRLTGVMR